MANDPDYTKHVTDEETEQVLDKHQDDLAEENRRMKAANDKNIADMQRISEEKQQQQLDDDDQKLSDRVVRQQRSEGKRIIPSAKEQLPSASRQVDKAEEQIADTDMQITQSKLAKYADKMSTKTQDPRKASRQKQHNVRRLGHAVIGIASAKALASTFKRHHSKTLEPETLKNEVQTQPDKANALSNAHEAKHLMSPVSEYAQLKQQQDDKLKFISQARELRNQEKQADPQSVAGIRKKMRMLAATELYPNATAETLTKKQLASLNGNAGMVLGKARNHANHDLHEISERMNVLEPQLPKTETKAVDSDKPKTAETAKTSSNQKPNETSSAKPMTVSNKDLGIGDTVVGTATATKSSPIDADVEKNGMADKQLDLDDNMHEAAGKTAENVDERIAELESKLADAQAENMQLRKQQQKRNKPSFIKKWKENQAKYAQMSTKSLVAATATRLGKATLKVSATVIAASLTAVAAVGYIGARKADKMANKIKSGMDDSVMRGVDPSLANQVDLGK